jgi:magnesium-transporting ATPase (P-type)
MCITYGLLLAWLVLFILLIVVTIFYTISWLLCSSDRVQNQGQGIDFNQFGEKTWFFVLQFNSIPP